VAEAWKKSRNKNCKVHSFLQSAFGHDNFTNPQTVVSEPSDRSVQTAVMPDLNNLQSLLEAGGVN
jgi:hypothetical protein